MHHDKLTSYAIQRRRNFPRDVLLFFDGEGIRVELNLCEKADLINATTDLSVLFLHRDEA